MLQKSIPESLARVRSFDKAGHVGDDEAAIAAQRHHTKIRHQGRERVVGDFGTRGRNPRDQRRLAGVGIADEADVCEQLEMKLELFGFAREPVFAAAGRPIRRADKSRVAAPADASLGHQHALAGFDEIADERRLFGRVFRLLVDERADRDLELDIGSVLAGAVRALAVAAAARVKLSIESEGYERVDVGAGNGKDGTALASVTTVGAAARNELLAPEAHAAGAAVSGLYEDVDFVDEHGGM